MSVYVTTYEIIGAHHLADDYYARRNAAHGAQWNFVRGIGGVGFRPNHGGGVQTVFFKALPTGWLKVGQDGDRIEARPRKGSLFGTALAGLPCVPQVDELASSYGYNPKELAIDDSKGVIYFPSLISTGFSARRHFLRLPRFKNDGFEPDVALLRAVPESELMAAIEAHDAEKIRRHEARNTDLARRRAHIAEVKRRRESHLAEAERRREGGAA